MHNAALQALDRNWKYLAFDVLPENLRDAIVGARALRLIGLNLTVPHKLLAVEMVDCLDESAQLWGAVNTISFETRTPEGPWVPLGQCEDSGVSAIRSKGFNTDADAIIRSLREDLGIEVKQASILLLGAGGAGRVAALKLAAEGASALYLVNRTVDRAAKLATEIQRRYPRAQVHLGYPDQGAVDLVLNATSLGLKTEDSLPLDRSRFSFARTDAVYDMIYRPAETPLLEAARNAGCKTANGLGMLLYQGAKALEIWTGLPAPVTLMKSALHEAVYG